MRVIEFGDIPSRSATAVSGSSTAAPANDQKSAVIAHGVLMSLAWVFFLPLGAMVPGHRWLLGDRMWRNKAVWFWLHLAFQTTGTCLFIAGFVLALVEFDRPTKGSLLDVHATMA